MVDAEIVKNFAVPMTHTPGGILKVEIMGALLVTGVLIATYGFRRWYLMMYEDWLLKRRRDERIDELAAAMKKRVDAGEEPGKDFDPKDYEINPEDWEPPLRSHVLNYIFIGGGIFLAVSGVLTWLLIPE